MKLNDASLLGRKLMDEHGLNDWSLAFDHAVKRFGHTRYKDKAITVSRHLTELNDEPRVRNTILHEIAHALVPVGTGHKRPWVQMARTIGCDGYREYGAAVTTPTMNYEATCPAGHTHKRVQRPRGKYICKSTRWILDWKRV